MPVSIEIMFAFAGIYSYIIYNIIYNRENVLEGFSSVSGVVKVMVNNIEKTFRPVYRIDHKPSRMVCVWFLLISSFFYLTAAINTASAATYYIDDVNGVDSNPGTSSEPWKTIGKAQSVVQSGDTVNLRNGNYGSFNQSNASYTDWVTYKNDSGHTPVLSEMAINNVSYLKFDGITVQQPDPGYDPNVPPWDVQYDLTRIQDANHVELRNCTIKGFNKYLLEFAIFALRANNLTIDHCDISKIRKPIMAMGCDNFVLSYNHIHEGGGGSPISIRFIEKASLPELSALIEGNHIHDSDWNESDDFYVDYHGGSGIALRIWNVVIRNNVIHNHLGQGIKFYGDSLGPDYFENMIVENNLIYDIGNYNDFALLRGPCIIRNNTFIGRIVNEANILGRYGGTPAFSVNLYGDGTGVEIYNNIIVGKWNLPDTTYNYNEDNNIFWSRYDAGASPKYRKDSKGVNTLIAVWQESPGITLHGYPELYEDLGPTFDQWTDEYPAGSEHNLFFVNPGYYTNYWVWDPDMRRATELNQDVGKTWDYTLCIFSPGINFGDPTKQLGHDRS